MSFIQNTLTCPHFGTCGSCQVYGETYVEQKLLALRNTLGDLSAVLKDPILLPPGTRRRAFLKASLEDNGEVSLGYYAPKSHDLINLSTCLVIKPEMAQLFTPLRTLLKECLLPHQKIELILLWTPKGLVIQVKGSFKSSPSILTFCEKHHIIAFYHEAKPLVLTTLPQVKFGSTWVTVEPSSFLQASEEADQALIDIALKNIPSKTKTVFDLFCGRGTFSLPFIEKGYDVFGYDADPSALTALRQATKKGTFFNRNLFKDPLTKLETKKADLILLDPPRDGAFAQCKILEHAKKIIYISCMPKTFLRDAQLLSERYHLEKIIPVDQFVWSSHLEIVGIFSKK